MCNFHAVENIIIWFSAALFHLSMLRACAAVATAATTAATTADNLNGA
jgi:hypothetical protein